MQSSKILIVEDEKIINNFITSILKAKDYKTISTPSGKEAVILAASHNPDLILLDLALPDMDGKEVLENIRSWTDLPVIVISARQNEQEKVDAFDAGANDYVTKPFGTNELLARIKSTLRTHERLKYSPKPQKEFSVGDFNISYDKHQVKVAGKRVHLTPVEFKIIKLLAQNAGKIITHDHMIKEIWGWEFTPDNSQVLRVNLANIRRKVEENPADPKYILTEIGVGYYMVDEEDMALDN